MLFNLRPAIEARLKEKIPTLTEVAGAVDLSTLMQGRINDGGVYVIPERIAGQLSEHRSVVQAQRIVLEFAVLIVINNVADPRGADAADQCAETQAKILKALIGWRESTRVFPMQYIGGQLFSAIGGYYIWKDNYQTTVLINGET